MANDQLPRPQRPWRTMGAAEVGQLFDPPVSASTVAMWRRRGEEYGHPFPEPDTETSTAYPGVFIAGWDRSRKAEFPQWKQGMPGELRKVASRA
jgi:hypothetical protein